MYRIRPRLRTYACMDLMSVDFTEIHQAGTHDVHWGIMPSPTLKKLPIDIQAFEIMRGENYVYVDKTRHIARMISEGRYYFLSRPRRFGKSLLVSTLKCLFQAKKELFEGLWIAGHGEWEWQAHPVILFDFSDIANDSPDRLKQALETALHDVADNYGLELRSPLLQSQFKELIRTLARHTEMPVAVLIDEYDKPIIDHLGRGEERLRIAEANRDILKSFFGVLKSGELAPILRFVFLTGISRFSKVSLFSELNNLIDLSMDEPYADLLGYTQEELESNFQAHIAQIAATLQSSYEEMNARLARYYNGYRFSERDIRVYNPYSILHTLHKQKFQDYWFETGTPSFLVHLLKEKQYNLPKIEGLQVSRSIFTSFDLSHLRPEALLFQTGYVTITDVQDGIYTLDYPNYEVKHAFSEALLFSLTAESNVEISSQILRLPGYLASEDFETFFETMRAIFASIPYDIETKRDEAYFHTIFYLLMTASGMAAESSVLTCEGRIDLVVIFSDKIYIIEFKCDQTAQTALRQIQEKHYADPYRTRGQKILLMGINFDSEKRNLAEWKVVQD